MRRLRFLALSTGLAWAVGSLQGCGDRGSSSEVHRTPEFQKAAMDSKNAMLEFAKSQQQQKKSRGGPRGR